MTKYEIGQKLEMFGIPAVAGADKFNGRIGSVAELPGYNESFPDAYGLWLDGKLQAVHPKYLRPFPPKLPNGRGDIDKKSTWEQFERATGVSTEVVKNGRPGNDY